MTIGLQVTVAGATLAQYEAVMAELDMASSDSGGWPDGLVSHFAGTHADGMWMFDVWDSRAAFDTFSQRLGPAMAAVGMTGAPVVTEIPTVNLWHHG